MSEEIKSLKKKIADLEAENAKLKAKCPEPIEAPTEEAPTEVVEEAKPEVPAVEVEEETPTEEATPEE